MLRSQRQGKSSKAPLADSASPLSPDPSQTASSPSTSHGWFSRPSKWFSSSSAATPAGTGTRDKEVSRKRSLDIKRTLGGGSSSGQGLSRSITPQPSLPQVAKAPASVSSHKFFRRPTFSHPASAATTPDEPRPPLPTARSTSANHQPTFVPLTHGDDESDGEDDVLPTPASNLSTASRKPWSRSVDDLSKLLSKSSGGGADGSSTGGSFWGQRRKGASELPPVMTYQAPAAGKPDEAVTDAHVRRPRRKTNSLAGHTLLASATAAQQESRPAWAKEYDGAMRLKMSSPPRLGGGLRSSESSPILNIMAGSPPAELVGERRGSTASKAEGATQKHRRSQSHSLLGLGYGSSSSQGNVKDEPTTAHTLATSPPSASTQLHMHGNRNATVDLDIAAAWQSYSSAAPATAATGNPAISSPILTPAQATRIERQGISLSPIANRHGSTPPSPMPSPGLHGPGSGSLSPSVTSFATPTTAHHFPSSLQTASSFTTLPSPVNSNLSPSAAFDINRSAKRASQVVARSGFLLKHPTPSASVRSAANSPSIAQGSFKPTPSPGQRVAADYFDLALHTPASSAKAADLSKGWKPYKVELKGSKLCFYKPPSDRRVAVEALFPAGIVPETIDAQPAPVSPERRQIGNQGRKRAYWGSAKHPQLLLYATPLDIDDPVRSKVKAGTMEAFAHELIFLTSFELPAEPDAEQLKRFAASHASFVDTIAFAHRRLSTTTKFVTELLRCVQMAQNATNPVHPAILRQCALRIVGRLVNTYGDDIQEGGQECRGALLEIVESVEDNADKHDDTRMILQALRSGPAATVVTPLQTTDWSRKPGSDAATLSGLGVTADELRAGLTSTALLKLDPHIFAKTLHAFHADALQTAVKSARLQDLVAAAQAQSDPRSQTGLLSMFAFSPQQPHFLSLLVLKHVFPQATPSPASLRSSVPLRSGNRSSSPLLAPQASSSTRGSAPVASALSPPHQRATTLQKWIFVGEAARLCGDAAGFVAIAMAICSSPVARLTQTWRRVSDESRGLVREVWASQLAAMGVDDTPDPKISPLSLQPDSDVMPIPFLGSVLDSLQRFNAHGLEALDEDTQLCAVETLYQVAAPVHNALEILSETKVTSGELIGAAVAELAAALQHLAFRGQPGHDHFSGFMAASLACEPPQLGTHADTFWKRKPASLAGPSSLLPLLWPEPLPTISLVNREALLEAARETAMRHASSNNLASTARGQTGSQPSSVIGLSSSGGKRLVRTRSLPPVRSSVVETVQMSMYNEARRQRRDFFGTMGGIGGLDERLIRIADGDLVLKASQPLRVSSNRDRSRPTSLIDSSPMSRQSSTGSSSLTAITSKRNSVPLSLPGGSTALRSSLHSSARNSLLLVDTMEPLRVVVKSGSLDRLMDILVTGLAGDTAHLDDTGLPGHGRRRFIVDLEEFRSTFFTTYRSFCLPSLLLKCLKKRYTFGGLAGTGDHSAGDLASQDNSSVTAVRLGVLAAMEHWITEGHAAQDCLDHPELYRDMLGFLQLTDLAGQAQLRLPENNFINEGYETERRRLLASLQRELLRPSLETEMMIPSWLSTRASPMPAQLDGASQSGDFDIDSITATRLVDLLDNVAATTYHKITELDFSNALEIIERQSVDKLGWYPVTSVASLDDDVVIQDLYTYFNSYLGSSSSSRPGEDVSFVKRLPASLRTTFRAHASIRRYLILQVAGPGVGLECRVTRVKMLLEALSLCRSRAVLADAVWSSPRPSQALDADPGMTTFVGKCIIAALLSPESRAHAKVWQIVADHSRGSTESLTSLLPTQTAFAADVDNGCTTDLAWLLERMLEIVCQIPDFAQEDQHMLNFDKRRYLVNLVRNAPTLANFARRVTRSTETLGVRTLTFMEQKLCSPQLDLRAIREEASKESLMGMRQQAVPSRTPRPFQLLVNLQQEKTRRDKLARDRLLREQRLERARVEKRDKDLNHLMKSSKPGRSGGSRVTAVFKSLYVRPMSIVTGAPTASRGELSPGRSAKQLDFDVSSKPSLVLSAVGARAQAYANSHRSYTFLIFTEDGAAPVLMQAATGADTLEWINAVNRVGQTTAAKRSTFLASTAVSEWESDLLPESLDGKSVYGASLENLATGSSEGVTDAFVPLIAEQCMAAIESRGLSEIGLYRIPGAVSAVNALRNAFDKGSSVDLTEDGPFPDIHVICGAFKMWLRMLPEPVFPTELYDKLIAAAQITAYEARLYAIRELIWTLSKPHFALLRRLMEHLDKVTDYEEHNQMPPSSLAIVFAPNLLKPSVDDGSFAASMTNLGHAANLIKSILLSYHWMFFDEVEGDADVSAPGTPTASAVIGLGIDHGDPAPAAGPLRK